VSEWSEREKGEKKRRGRERKSLMYDHRDAGGHTLVDLSSGGRERPRKPV